MAHASYRSDSTPLGAGGDGYSGDGGRESLRLDGECPRERNIDEDILDVKTAGDNNAKIRSDVCPRSTRNSSSMRRLGKSDGITESSNTAPEQWRSKERDKLARPGRSPWPQLAGEIVEFDAHHYLHGKTNHEGDRCSLPSSNKKRSPRTLSEDSLV